MSGKEKYKMKTNISLSVNVITESLTIVNVFTQGYFDNISCD